VTYPLELDAYDFCSPELKKALDGPRAALKDWQDKKAMEKKTAKQQKLEDGSAKPSPAAGEGSSSRAAAATAGEGSSSAAAAGTDVEMKDAGDAGAAQGSSSTSFVGAATGGWDGPGSRALGCAFYLEQKLGSLCTCSSSRSSLCLPCIFLCRSQRDNLCMLERFWQVGTRINMFCSIFLWQGCIDKHILSAASYPGHVDVSLAASVALHLVLIKSVHQFCSVVGAISIFKCIFTM
jgi:hypothetical protein